MEKGNRFNVLRNAYTSLLKVLDQEINDLLIENNEDPNDYLIKSYPISLTRKDGKEISPHIIKALEILCQTPQFSLGKNHLTLVAE